MASVESAYRSLRDLVGQRGPRVEATVTSRDISRFAFAVGETEHDSEVAHPLLLSSTFEWGAGVPQSQLRADGTGTSSESWLPLEGLRLMGGGQDLTLHAPVTAGASFVAEQQLEAVELKEGDTGALLLLRVVTDYRDSGTGELLVNCRETFIVR